MENSIILYTTTDGKSNIALYAREGNVWLNQSQLAELFATSIPNISMHIRNILKEKELRENSVVKYYLTTAADGKNYRQAFYSLEMILAIGFRVRSVRGTQFRQWANQNLAEFLIKGFVMDDERLKNPNGRPDYFDELLERIRDIRRSEKRFYQKVRDLFALSSDYDRTDKATQMFFAETQNRLLYAVTHKTAAEIVMDRASADLANFGATSWKGSIVRKGDIFTAKNYLNADEIDTLNRLVTIFLETAELRVKNQQDLTLGFWRNNVEQLLTFNGYNVLHGTGSISNQDMERIVEERYITFDTQRKSMDAALADREDMAEMAKLEDIEKQIRKRGKGKSE